MQQQHQDAAGGRPTDSLRASCMQSAGLPDRCPPPEGQHQRHPASQIAAARTLSLCMLRAMLLPRAGSPAHECFGMTAGAGAIQPVLGQMAKACSQIRQRPLKSRPGLRVAKSGRRGLGAGRITTTDQRPPGISYSRCCSVPCQPKQRLHHRRG